MKKSSKVSKKKAQSLLYIPRGYEINTRQDCSGFSLMRRIGSGENRKRFYRGYLNIKLIMQLIQLPAYQQRQQIIEFAEAYVKKKKNREEN